MLFNFNFNFNCGHFIQLSENANTFFAFRGGFRNPSHRQIPLMGAGAFSIKNKSLKMGPKLTVFVVVENIVVGEQFLISVRYGWVGVLVQRWGGVGVTSDWGS